MSGFDADSVRSCCHQYGIHLNIALNPPNGTYTERDEVCDEALYAYRFVIEHTHAWLDDFRALLIRFEKCTTTWLGPTRPCFYCLIYSIYEISN
jgi:transposase